MQVDNKQKTASTSGISGDGSFTANMDGIAFQTMISTLYKDKPRAVVRETIANCRDAHTWRDYRADLYNGTITAQKLAEGTLSASEQQKYDELKALGYSDPGTPYHIHLPTDLEPYLEFSDFGVGMTLEEAIGEIDKEESEVVGHPVRTGGFINTMFKSGKRGENMSIGGFGLGCKSPLSITDSFTYRVIKHGLEHQFIIFFSKGGRPDVSWITRDEDYNPKPIKTDRENGVVVRIEAISSSLFSKLRNSTADILQTFPADEQPIINDGEYKYTPMKTTQVTDTVYMVEEYNYGTMFQNNFLVETGGVVYPIDSYKVSELFEHGLIKFLQAGSDGKAIVLRMPIGSIGIPPSREEISYDDSTVDNIKEELERAKLVFESECKEVIGNTDFLSKFSVEKTWEYITKFYHTDESLEVMKEQLKKASLSPEFENIEVSISLNRKRYEGDLIHTLIYSDEFIRSLEASSISVLDRLMDSSLTHRVQFTPSIRLSGTFIENDLFEGFGKSNKVVINHLPEIPVILVNDNCGEPLKILEAFQRTAQSIKSLGSDDHTSIQKEMGSNFTEACNRLRHERDTVLYLVQPPLNAVNHFLEQHRNELKDECGYSSKLSGPPRLDVYKVLKKAERLERKSYEPEKTVEVIKKCLDLRSKVRHTHRISVPIVVKTSELQEMVERTKVVKRKYRRKVPKKSEISRNVKSLWIDNGRFESVCTNYSGNYVSSDNHLYDSIHRYLTDFESVDIKPVEERIVFWITEENFNKVEKNTTISKKQLVKFCDSYCEGNTILIVKGVRTDSRKLFDSCEFALEITLEDVITDINAMINASYTNGTNEVFYEKELNYLGLWKYGFTEFKEYLLTKEIFNEFLNPREMRRIIRKIKMKSLSNPAYAEYIKKRGFDLDRMFNFVTRYILNDIHLAEIFPYSPTCSRWSCRDSDTSLKYNFIREPRKRVLQKMKRVNCKVHHFSDYTMLDLEWIDGLPNWFNEGCEVSEDYLRDLLEVTNFFTNDVEGNNRELYVKSIFGRRHEAIKQTEVDTMYDGENLDVTKVRNLVIKKLSNELEHYNIKPNEITKARIDKEIEVMFEDYFLRKILHENPFFISKRTDPRYEIPGYLKGLYNYSKLKDIKSKYEHIK